MAALVKILVPLSRSAAHSPPAPWEALWARRVRDGYVLCNIPFYADGLALGDVVAGVPESGQEPVLAHVRPLRGRAPEGPVEVLEVGPVKRRSGHDTYRVLFKTPDEREAALARFAALGLLFESSIPSLFSVDVPPHLRAEVRELLLDGIEQGRWEAEESLAEAA